MEGDKVPRLRVLAIDDSEADTTLLVRELRRGYDVILVRVATPDALRAALKSPWDVVISDWSMPSFDGLAAFRIVREVDVDLPFILSSGVIDEEVAVTALRAGVHDFIAKGRYARLLPSIARELREAAIRRRQRETEEQLRHAQKMEAVGRLAGNVAHDFNNVLTVIQSMSTFLEDDLPPGAQRDDAIEIRLASERGAAITRQLLALSRHAIVAPRPLDLGEVVDGFAPMLRRLLGERVTLAIRHAKVPDVIADRGQIEQIILNLAVNARDAMPEGGRITIETEVVGPDVLLEISDTGVGMDAATQRRVFDPFFTTKEAGKGTGLGLSIVHDIVTQAGGTIAIHSEPGHGTTVRVALPAAHGSARASVREIPMPPRTLPEITVLVVDDAHEVRKIAGRILRDAGCRVLEAASAKAAQQICVEHEGAIGAILIDVILADARGDLLGRELRELRPGAAIVLMSGYPAGALTSSGDAPPNLLAKPFTPAELRGAVACALDRTADDAVEARDRVLLADDDETLRRSLARILHRANFEVLEADSARAAFALLERAPVDVILSDIHMPDGNGLDLLVEMRRRDPDVPVILMSGHPDVASAAAAVEYGAFRYLTKPIGGDALVKLLAHATRAHALARLRRT